MAINLKALDYVDGDVVIPYLKNKKLPAENSILVYTKERLDEIDKCRRNLSHYAENYFYINTADDGKKIIKMYPAQKKILKSFEKNRLVITLASRQAGKTTLMTVFALHMACFRDDTRIIVVANKESTAKNILKRIKMAYENMPNWLKPTVKQWDVTEVVFGNDSSIMITSTTSTAARGETANLLLIDEMAHIPHSFMSDFWRAVTPIISSSKKTKIFAISTSNGTGNMFYDIYSKAEKGGDAWKAERIDWWDVPGRDEKWMKDTIQTIGSQEAFDMEFGNSFEQTGESAIKSEIIKGLKAKVRDPIIVLYDGCYKIWEAPQKGRIYIMGSDAGEGIGQTASVVNVLDITDLTDIRQVALYRNNTLNPYQFSRILFEIAGQWGSPYIALERNGVGGGVLDTLYKQYRYSRIVNYIPSQEESYERQGILSHTNVKNEAVTNYRYWLNELDAVTLYDLGTIQEIETFVKHPNGVWKKKVGDKIYDDCVMGLIWGLFALKPEICEKYYEILKYDQNGKPLKIRNGDYNEEVFFGADVIHKTFDDGMPITPIVSPLSMDNYEMDGLAAQGWSLF